MDEITLPREVCELARLALARASYPKVYGKLKKKDRKRLAALDEAIWDASAKFHDAEYIPHMHILGRPGNTMAEDLAEHGLDENMFTPQAEREDEAREELCRQTEAWTTSESGFRLRLMNFKRKIMQYENEEMIPPELWSEWMQLTRDIGKQTDHRLAWDANRLAKAHDLPEIRCAPEPGTPEHYPAWKREMESRLTIGDEPCTHPHSGYIETQVRVCHDCGAELDDDPSASELYPPHE